MQLSQGIGVLTVEIPPKKEVRVLAEVKRVGEVGRTVLHQELLDILAFCRA